MTALEKLNEERGNPPRGNDLWTAAERAVIAVVATMPPMRTGGPPAGTPLVDVSLINGDIRLVFCDGPYLWSVRWDDLDECWSKWTRRKNC